MNLGINTDNHNILYQKINLVQLASLPDTEEENMIHLIDLEAYIDNFNTKIHNSLSVIPTTEGPNPSPSFCHPDEGGTSTQNQTPSHFSLLTSHY